MAREITLEDITFDGNECSQINSDRTPVTVTNSTFINGMQDSYINLRGAALLVDNTNFTQAQDAKAHGRGISCVNCPSVDISNSEFSDLQGYVGGAIYLRDSKDGNIQNTTFYDNLAT